jgi:hypothetical protein
VRGERFEAVVTACVKAGGFRYMLTQEENELLTRVGPGTPCGDLLRRYWMPCALARDLTPAQPTRFVRLLGEMIMDAPDF